MYMSLLLVAGNTQVEIITNRTVISGLYALLTSVTCVHKLILTLNTTEISNIIIMK